MYKEINKISSNIQKEVTALIKPESCLICKKKSTSFCNSHNIPEFVLRKIDRNGYLNTALSAMSPDSKLNILKPLPLRNTNTFKLICHTCDNHVFKPIESIISLDNSLSISQLNVLALKNSLRMLYHKLGLNVDEEVSKKYGIPKKSKPHVFNAKDAIYLQKYFTQFLDSFYRVKMKVLAEFNLDYKVNFAISTMIVPVFDYNGKIINTTYIYSDKANPNTGYLHCSVLPYDDQKTKVLLFYPQKYKNMVKLFEQFKKLSPESQLKEISDLIILYSNEVFFNNNEISKLYQTNRDLILYDPTQNMDYRTYMFYKGKLTNFNLFNTA